MIFQLKEKFEENSYKILILMKTKILIIFSYDILSTKHSDFIIFEKSKGQLKKNS